MGGSQVSRSLASGFGTRSAATYVLILLAVCFSWNVLIQDPPEVLARIREACGVARDLHENQHVAWQRLPDIEGLRVMVLEFPFLDISIIFPIFSCS